MAGYSRPALHPTAAASIALGESKTCTITNTAALGRIVIDKVTIPSGSAAELHFHLTGGPPGLTPLDQRFDLTDAAGSVQRPGHPGSGYAAAGPCRCRRAGNSRARPAAMAAR